MSMGVWLRLFLIVVGLGILSMTIVSLARKHMTESFCTFWGLVSFLFIAAGIMMRPVEWNRYISGHTLTIILFSAICTLVAGVYLSLRISSLMRQVTELAMQVSLLNQENKIVLTELGEKNKAASE